MKAVMVIICAANFIATAANISALYYMGRADMFLKATHENVLSIINQDQATEMRIGVALGQMELDMIKETIYFVPFLSGYYKEAEEALKGAED